jgi:hypothetical protein
MTKGKERPAVCCFRTTLMILVLIYPSQGSPGRPTPSGSGQSGEEGPRLHMVPGKGPPEELKSRMRCWWCRTEDARSSFRSSWTGVALAIGRGDRARIEALCRRLRSDVEALQNSFPEPAPDPIAWFYLARGIRLIHQATANCSESRVFALSYGLSRARRMFRQLDSRMEALDYGSCTTDSSSASICRD